MVKIPRIPVSAPKTTESTEAFLARFRRDNPLHDPANADAAQAWHDANIDVPEDAPDETEDC